MSPQRAEALAPFRPLLVSSRSDITDALIARRHALGWSGEMLDDRAGFSDRYGAKLERPLSPTGKLGFGFSHPCEVLPTGTVRASGMADVWLQSLGVRLVLVDAATADAIGAVSAPSEPTCRRGWTGGDAGPAHARRRIQRGKQSPMTASQFEAADRTQVAGLSFRVAVTDHSWLAGRPALKAKAEAIEAQLVDLAEQIRQDAA